MGGKGYEQAASLDTPSATMEPYFLNANKLTVDPIDQLLARIRRGSPNDALQAAKQLGPTAATTDDSQSLQRGDIIRAMLQVATSSASHQMLHRVKIDFVLHFIMIR